MMTKGRTKASWGVAAGVLLGLSCSGQDGGQSQHHATISGFVWWSAPVSGARLECWQRLPDGTLYGSAPIATGTTDATGAFTLDIGEQGNVVELRAFGGSFVDAATGAMLNLDASAELRSVQQNVELDEQRKGAVISPLTELMVALADKRRAIGKPDSVGYDDSLNRARSLLGTHAMEIDLTGVAPADVTSAAAQPATSPTDGYRYGVLLAGMSTYAAKLATASGLTVQDLNISHLTHAWEADLTSDEALFDGMTATGPAHVGACPLVDGCTASSDFHQHPECRSECDQFSNSPRARWARATLDFLADATRNRSGLKPDDLRSRLEKMSGNTEPQLFDDTPPEPLLTTGPTITFASPSGTVKGSIDIKVTATSPVGVTSLAVAFQMPGAPALVDQNPAPDVFEVHGFDSTKLAEGDWTLVANAEDSLANKAETTTTFNVDNIGSGTISGLVWKGPIDGATVHVYGYTAGAKGALLGSGTTDATGQFANVSLQQGYSGPLLVEAGFTGHYTEEASPVLVAVDVDNVMRTVVPAYQDGSGVGSVSITPLTTFAVTYFEYLKSKVGGSVDVAALWTQATGVMQDHFDVPDIVHLAPAAPSSITTLSAAARYSMAIVGLSRRALEVSSTKPDGKGDAGSYGSVMNSLVAMKKLDTDLADGCWDGKVGGAGGADVVYGGTTKVSKDDTRVNLANAIVGYIGGSENATPFKTAGDVLALLDTLSLGGPTTGDGSCAGGGIYPDAGKGFDQEPPTVTFVGMTPGADAYVHGAIQVAAVGDDHGIDLKPSTIFTKPTGLLDLDGDNTDADATANIDTALPPGDGPLQVIAQSTDDSGNVGTAVRTFTVDNTAPVVSVTGVQNGDTYADNRVIGFSQSDANPDKITATLNGSAITSGTLVTLDGDYTLVVNAVDLAKNAAAPVTIVFHIDRQAPVITVTGVDDGQYYNSNRTIAYSASGTGSTVSATLNGAPFASSGVVTAEGTYTLIVNAASSSGVPSSTTTHFTIDKTAPVISVAGVANGISYGQNVFITFNQTDTNAGTTAGTLNSTGISSGYPVVNEGDFTLQVTAVDLAGNAATPVNISFSVDKTAPVISIGGVTSSSYYNSNRTITFSDTDAHPQTLTATLNNQPITSGTVVTAEGTYSLVVQATDKAGNASSTTVAFVVDKTPPVINLAGVAAGIVYNDNRSITFSQDDANPGATSATLNNSAIFSGYLVTADGEYDLQVTSSDKAGNSATPIVLHFSLDRTAPTINVTGVADGAFYNTTRTVAYSQTDAHPGTTTATLNGNPFPTGGTASAEGTFALHVAAADAAGNATTKDVGFVIDKTAPVVTISGVVDGTWYNAAVTPVVMVSDTYLQTSSITLDGSAYVSGTVITAQGAHTLVASGTDKAGNTTSKTVAFTVDTSPPTVTWDPATPADGSFPKGVFHVVATAVDNLALTGFTMTQPTGLPDVDTTIQRLDVVFDTSTLGDQTLVVKLQAQDKAGNAFTATRSVIIDTTAPTISVSSTGFLSVGSALWTKDSGASLTGTAVDAHFKQVSITDTTTNKVCGTTTSSSWSIALASCWAEGANSLTITATDQAGNAFSQLVTVGLDTTSPDITIKDSAVKDESKDTVTTFSGTTPIAPVHTHSTSPSDIPAIDRSNCATPIDLSLYGYLHDQDAPAYGSETTKNPFVWAFTPADGGVGVDPTAGATQYRVSLKGGAVLVDWANVPVGADGVTYSVTLYRKLAGGSTTSPAIPQLGTVDGTFQIDLRTQDRLGHATTETRCWKHHPLAAPLSVQSSAAAATTVGASKVALSSFKLNDPASPSIPTFILNDGSPGSGLTEFKITNMTVEPAYVTLALTPPATNPTYVMSSQFSWAETTYDDNSQDPIACPSQTAGACTGRGTLKNVPSDLSGTIAPSYTQRVFETTGGGATVQSSCSGCSSSQYLLAPRAGANGREYTVQSAIKTIPELRPSGGSPPFSSLTVTYYPSASSTTTTAMWINGQVYGTTQACDLVKFYKPVPTDPGTWACFRTGTFQQYRALKHVSVAFQSKQFTADVFAAPTSSIAAPKIASVNGNANASALDTSITLPSAP